MKLVKLNVGGLVFVTTDTTLCPNGEENYFSGLLSESFGGNLVLEDGSYFIDRSGDTFSIILEYLRSGEIFNPKNIPNSLIMKEAEYYCLFKLVHFLKNSCKIEAVDYEIRYDGYYTNNEEGEATIAIQFREIKKGDTSSGVVIFTGKNAQENIKIIHTTRTVPELWKTSELSVTFASFCTNFYRRGTYKQQGRHLMICLSQNTPPFPGIFYGTDLLLPSKLTDRWFDNAFSKYTFVPLLPYPKQKKKKDSQLKGE